MSSSKGEEVKLEEEGIPGAQPVRTVHVDSRSSSSSEEVIHGNTTSTIAAGTTTTGRTTKKVKQTINTVKKIELFSQRQECIVLPKKKPASSKSKSCCASKSKCTKDDVDDDAEMRPTLDWTKLGTNDDLPARFPEEIAEWNATDTDITIIGTQGQKITYLGDVFSDPTKTNIAELHTLVLRIHQIKEMKGLEKLQKLETLELYDNMIEELDVASIKGIGNYGTGTLRVIDMSYNTIRDMAPLRYCNGSNTITELYLANNKIKELCGINHLKNLRKLDLGYNRIRTFLTDNTDDDTTTENESTSRLSGLENLEELWIGKNKLESLDGLQNLTKLRRLDVQGNRLISLVDDNNVCYLNAQRGKLEELYLALNGLTNDSLAGLLSTDTDTSSQQNKKYVTFPKLTVLDLSRNRLNSIDALFKIMNDDDGSTSATGPGDDDANVDVNVNDVVGYWPVLESLWLSGNMITHFNDLEIVKVASTKNLLPDLDTLYLEYNPIAKDYEYRTKIAQYIPQLKQLDSTYMHGHGHTHGSWSSSVLSSATNNTKNKNTTTTEEKLRVLQEVALLRAKQQQQQQ